MTTSESLVWDPNPTPPPQRALCLLLFFNLSVLVRHWARYAISLMASVLFYLRCSLFFIYVVINVLCL